MCGIGGWFGHLPLGSTHAAEMARRLHHRGPDAEGIRRWDAATLVHTRLSILDLTPTGHQPLSDETGRTWTVFNGEIYNHRELRDSLEPHGHVFRGRSDTEVLPHLYEESPADVAGKLRGMFAFAVYDSVERRLLLCRDRFGIKPLFYAVFGDGIAFASEVRALLCLPGVDTTVDPQALYDYTALAYVPAPLTFFRGIRALEAGGVLEASLVGGCFQYRLSRYHSWTLRPDPMLSLASAVARADAAISGGVRSQLESDVPIGSLLSGGIDSSLVSAAAQAALAPAKLRTFNVRFPDAQYDETWAARMVAEAAGTEHETLDFLPGSGTPEEVRELLAHTGQPFADTSLFAVNAVARLMRQRVKVALSGDGGDEAFGGYDLYWQLGNMATLRRLPGPMLTAGRLTARAVGAVSAKYDRWADRLGDLVGNDDAAVVGSLFRWVRDTELHTLLPDLEVEPIRRHFERKWDHVLPDDASALEKLSALATEVNVRLTLPNDFLFKVDAGSMRESLEVRVPMLDEGLFDLGLSLPHRLKVRNRTGKMVLRTLASEKLPSEVARKPKWGFGVPVDTWLGTAFRTWLRETVLLSRTPLSDYYSAAAYRPLIGAFCDRRELVGISRQGLYQRVIMLLAAHVALEGRTSDRPLAPEPTSQPVPGGAL